MQLEVFSINFWITANWKVLKIYSPLNRAKRCSKKLIDVIPGDFESIWNFHRFKILKRFCMLWQSSLLQPLDVKNCINKSTVKNNWKAMHTKTSNFHSNSIFSFKKAIQQIFCIEKQIKNHVETKLLHIDVNSAHWNAALPLYFSPELLFSLFFVMSNMLLTLKFMKIYVFIPKNEFYPFTVSCFMNFHHPFMFDNFSPFSLSLPRLFDRYYGEHWELLVMTLSQFVAAKVFHRIEPICSWKFNQLQFVGIFFNFNKPIFSFFVRAEQCECKKVFKLKKESVATPVDCRKTLDKCCFD